MSETRLVDLPPGPMRPPSSISAGLTSRAAWLQGLAGSRPPAHAPPPKPPETGR